MINFTTDPNYSTNLYERLKLLEGSKAKLYLDTKGHPTIGLGFDLRDPNSLTEVLRGLGISLDTTQRTTIENIISKSYSSNTALQTAVNNQMQIFHNQNSAIPATLEFASDTDPLIKTVWTTLVVEYETRVDKWLAGIPVDSTEREVFVSLAYNGLINAGNNSPSLRKDVTNGNRAEGWYEIRYNSNLDNQHSDRRYLEAHDFKLFKDTKATNEEAHQAAESYTIHRSAILSYEKSHNPLTSTYSSYGIQDIYHELQPAIIALQTEYDIPSGFVIEEVQAATSSIVNLNGDGTAYDSSINDQDLLIGNSDANTLDGGVGADALVGLEGNDTLTGGTGDDQFIINSGDGNDIIADTTLDVGDRVVYNGGILSGEATNLANGNYKLNGYVLEKQGNDLYITSDGNATGVTVRAFFPAEYDDTQVHTMMGITIPAEKNDDKIDISINKIQHDTSKVSPIVLDLNGDGLKYITYNYSYGKNAHFDIDNDGFAEGMVDAANDNFFIKTKAALC